MKQIGLAVIGGIVIFLGMDFIFRQLDPHFTVNWPSYCLGLVVSVVIGAILRSEV